MIFVAINPRAIDCLIDSFDDPLIRTFVSINFTMNYDTVYAFDLADLAQFVKLEVPQLEQCFEEFRRKGMIVTSSTRHGCYEELDTLLLSQPLDVFSCPVDPV